MSVFCSTVCEQTHHSELREGTGTTIQAKPVTAVGKVAGNKVYDGDG